MVDMEKIVGWLSDYAMLKENQAKKVQDTYGVGDISNAQFAVAKEVMDWVNNNGEIERPISIGACMTPDNYKISHIFPNNSYMKYKYADGTVKIVGVGKSEK